MKKPFVLLYFFLLVCSFAFAQGEVDEDMIRKMLSEAYTISGDYESAAKLYKDILQKEPANVKARISLADVLSWNKKYDEAINEYKKAFDLEPGNIEIKKKLADVLSWVKNYEEAIKLYDEALKEKENTQVRLQKARVLGWMREYRKAAAEYQKIIDIRHNPLVELEMRAKKAYWSNRARKAIAGYSGLIERDPQNAEAMFDLSQIYCYQSMFKEAQTQFGKILAISPEHFRAREGLQKIDLLANHCSAKSGYEFFEADSTGRDWDLKRHSFWAQFGWPLDYDLRMELDYRRTERSFSDFGDVRENEGKLKITCLNNPDWQTALFYDFIFYNKDIDTRHTFGADAGIRIFDMGRLNTSYEREGLENNSVVIRDNIYRDNYKQRMYLDINKRLKIGADYLWAYYSDSNYKHEPGLDFLYYFSLEPKSFTVKYRYFYQNFRDKRADYWTPKGLSTGSLSFDWRHYLNKEEIFFGCDDLYYNLGYEVSLDSKDIVSHKFKAELNWDINKRLNFNLKGSVTNSSAGVYNDKNAVVSLKYYF